MCQLDVKQRHHNVSIDDFGLKNGGFRRIIQNVELYPGGPAGLDNISGYCSNANFVFREQGVVNGSQL